jgi:iron complex outermembrane recepter protein
MRIVRRDRRDSGVGSTMSAVLDGVPGLVGWITVCLLSTAHASDRLEEIVVTAQKIEEDPRRVPVSMQVLTGAFLDATRPASLYTLQHDVPGLVVQNRGMFGAGISLRGVADQGGGGQSVAVHANGVYLGQSQLALARPFDLERIEVLKGPQGTLYGRNATGGTLNFIARKPATTNGVALDASLGSFSTRRIEARLNLALPRVGLRLAVIDTNGDGYIRNTEDDRRFGDENFTGMRLSLAANPVPALTLDVSAQRVLDDGGMHDLWLPNRANLPDAGDYQLTRVTDTHPNLHTRNDLVTVNAGYDFGSVSVHALTGYAENETHNRDDCAADPMLEGCVRTLEPGLYTQWSQEFRLVSKPGARTDWIAGLYFFDGEEDTHFFLEAPRAAALPIYNYRAQADERAWAVFGQATRALGSRSGITAGVRYSAETLDVANAGTGLADNPTPAVADDNWRSVSWRLGWQFEPRSNALLYGSVATGFKAGGVTTERLPDGNFDAYEPEYLTAWELGVKWRAVDARRSLAASLFYYDFRDLQVQTTAFVNNYPTSVVDNAAQARIAGLDIALEADLAEHWTLAVACVWLPEREFVEFVTATGNSLDGNVLSRAPEWSATASAVHRWPLASGSEWSARLDYSYRSGVFFTKENLPLYFQSAFSLVDLFLGFERAGTRWSVYAAGRNLLDQDYFDQAFIQTAPGKPRTWELGVGMRY